MKIGKNSSDFLKNFSETAKLGTIFAFSLFERLCYFLTVSAIYCSILLQDKELVKR
jgi:hypothetical protein